MAEDVTVAEVVDWAVGLDQVLERIGPRFARAEPRARAGVYLRGLLSAAERKNGWTLAEQAGDATPDAMQRLLNHADWDADAVRDDLRAYVLEHLGDERAVLVIDEAGFGPDVPFQTKPELAVAMLTRALDAGVPAGWVAADEIYGQNAGLRLALEERGLPYVLAVPVNQYTIGTVDGRIGQHRVDVLSAAVPPAQWRRLSAGRGAKGPRLYDWVRIPVRPLSEPDRYWLLARRRLADGELTHYLCFCPPDTSLADLVAVAGRRWAIEESFQTAKGEVGLDHYQVRRYDAWYRHITLACWAHAFLAVTRTATRDPKAQARTCTAS